MDAPVAKRTAIGTITARDRASNAHDLGPHFVAGERRPRWRPPSPAPNASLTCAIAYANNIHMSHVSNMINRIVILDAAPGPVLSGALRGQQLFVKLLGTLTAEPAAAQPVFLDFSGVEAATASFLRESVLAFRDMSRGRRSNLYPVVANANEAVREDLTELVKSRGGVLLTCELDQDGRISGARVIGDLDPKQQLTFDLVRKRGETDAAELMREHGAGESVGPTAWNNRLAALVGLGLVIEDVTSGRTKRYRPLLQGV